MYEGLFVKHVEVVLDKRQNDPVTSGVNDDDEFLSLGDELLSDESTSYHKNCPRNVQNPNSQNRKTKRKRTKRMKNFSKIESTTRFFQSNSQKVNKQMTWKKMKWMKRCFMAEFDRMDESTTLEQCGSDHFPR